jgi:DMSO/TMAO reductase YedYZ molybdopterin-dependent catalytic subunit
MNNPTRKQRFAVGFTAGLAAGVVGTAVMLFLSVYGLGVSLPEAFGSMITALMPASVFSSLHQAIGDNAKEYLFYIIVVGQCVVFALSGAACDLLLLSAKPDPGASVAGSGTSVHRWRPSPGETRLTSYHGLALAFVLWLLTGFGLLPLTGSGVFGASLTVGLLNSALSLAVVGIVFGLLFVSIQNWLFARSEQKGSLAPGISRRSVLRGGIIVAGAVLLGVGVWRLFSEAASNSAASVTTLLQNYKSKIVPPPTPNYGALQPVQGLSPEVTSNDQFYIVSKNLFSDPTVNGNTWQLTVDGMVDHPLKLNYQQMLALPMQKQYETLECISNDVGGGYMSNALWEGVPLRALLQQAGVQNGASKIVFYAADDYSDSIHIEKALEPTTLLAVRMNGATLPQEHGFPVRMLVPGIYGMKHCKWLTRIQVVNQNYQGYWEERGWDDLAAVQLTSRIDTPAAGANIPHGETTYIAGVAFSGNKGIAEVDISVDGGQTWERATLKRPLSGLTWVLWEYPWRPEKQGTYTLVVRAVDLGGNVQTPQEAPPAPTGATGYDSFDVSVV